MLNIKSEYNYIYSILYFANDRVKEERFCRKKIRASVSKYKVNIKRE